jgi:predicted MFS family arabinose efflux permease
MLVDRGVPAPVAATALAAAGLSLIGGRLLAGFALDRIFGPYVAGFFFLVPLIGIGIFLSNGVSASSGAVAVVAIGLGLGAEVDLIAFLLSRYLGLKSFGELYGYMFAAFMLGSGSGPYIMGLVFDKTGNYTAAVMGMGGLLIMATLLTMSLGRYTFAKKTEPAAPQEGGMATAHAH